MKSILILIDKLARGGAERLIADFVPRLDPSRFRAIVCSLGKQTTMAQEMRGKGIDVITADIGKWNPLAYRRIAALVQEHHIDLIHAHLAKSIVLGYFAARRAKVKFIAHEHVGPMWPHFGGSPLHRLENWFMCHATLYCMSRSDAVISVAQSTHDWIVERRPRLAAKSTVITNGIDLDFLREMRERKDEHRTSVRDEFGLPSGCPVVLYAASFRYVKRWDLFIRAAARVLVDRPDVHFLGAGTGPLHGEMGSLIGELGVAKHVHFIGVRGDVPRLMAASDVFLMPSSMESDSIVVKEAMALGLPVVGSAIPALCEKLTDGQDGFLVNVGDTQAMADRCLDLLSDRNRWHRMSERAAEVAAERFSIEQCTKNMEALYERVL